MSDPELTAAQEAEVRRRLADARHTDPMPAEVAARLDGVLAELAAERAASPGPPRAAGASQAAGPPAGPPSAPASDYPDLDQLEGRRRTRRRRVFAGLVAAAAVTIGGLSVPALLQSTGDSDTAGSADSAGTDAGENALEQPSAGQGSTEEQDSSSEAASGPRAPRVVTSDQSFEADMVALLRDRPRLGRGVSERNDSPGRCGRRSAWGPGATAPALFLDANTMIPSVVVVSPEEGGVRTVRLYPCGQDQPLRSTTVPVE